MYLLIFYFELRNDGSLMCCLFPKRKKKSLNYDVMNKTIFIITQIVLVLFSYSNYKLYK